MARHRGSQSGPGLRLGRNQAAAKVAGNSKQNNHVPRYLIFCGSRESQSARAAAAAGWAALCVCVCVRARARVCVARSVAAPETPNGYGNGDVRGEGSTTVVDQLAVMWAGPARTLDLTASQKRLLLGAAAGWEGAVK